LKRLPAQL